jgi:hypothetical protein
MIRLSDRSPLEEQFRLFKIFEMSAIFKMAAKTRHKKWAFRNFLIDVKQIIYLSTLFAAETGSYRFNK